MDSIANEELSTVAEWFRSGTFAGWLDDHAPTEKMLRRMQRELDDWQIQLVVTLRETRSRIHEKFPFPDLLATPVALEQASDFAIAQYKAARFVDHATIDMCTGMGGDLIALCNGGEPNVVGVEIDGLLSVLAAENVQRATGHRIEVRRESCLATTLSGEWIHIDPDRRSEYGRTSDAAFYEPTWNCVLQLMEQSPGGAAKVAPAAEFDSPGEDWQQEWVERAGQCRQQLIWWKEAAATPGRRLATAISDIGHVAGQWEQRLDDSERVVSEQLGDFLHEPSPSILAAELVDDIAAGLDLGRVAPGAVYLTGTDVAHPLLSSFRILDVLPLDRKKIIAHIRQRSPRSVEVKKRGIDQFDPNELQRTLKKKKCLGDQTPLVVIAVRMGSKRLAIIAERAVIK